MTARNYTVLSGSATSVQEFPLPRDLFIVNQSTTATVYLDTTRGVTATSGMPLPPQSTKRWESGDPCFAICASGETATINVSDNAGELNNPAAVAGQILTQGLAGSIASAITLSGVPIIDSPTQLYDDTQIVASNNFPNDTGLIDVSRYQTVTFSVQETNMGTPGLVSIRDYTLQWLDSVGNVLDVDNFMTSLCSGTFLQAKVPCKGSQLRITPASAITTTNATITIQIYGSYRPANKQRWRILPTGLMGLSGTVSAYQSGDYGVFTMQAALAAGATVTEYPYVYSGPATLHVVQTTTSTGTVKPQITVSHMSNSRRICWSTIPIGQFGSDYIPFYIPKEPIIVSISNAATNANTFVVSISMDGYSN